MNELQQIHNEIRELQRKLAEKDNELELLQRNYNLTHNLPDVPERVTVPINSEAGPLPTWAIERYSRQILLREIGVEGQAKICATKVLIVGAGGLGCPAAMYLAGAGVGVIGIVDPDKVEISNIHRQISHKEMNLGFPKSSSAADTVSSLNSRVICIPYRVPFDKHNAFRIASKYDIILDCTDNAPTRYLLNDLAIMLKVPLISGSALKLEGQLTVYGYRSDLHGANEEQIKSGYRGPCYRCVFPVPPNPDTMGSCSQHGVAGPVTGVIGTLQAMEAIKLIVGYSPKKLLVERMMLMDVDDMTCKVVQLRPRNVNCAVCSDNPTITTLIDYEAFCKTTAREQILDLHILPPANRITATGLEVLFRNEQSTMLIDVRPRDEFNMCHIGGSFNYPIDIVESRLDELTERVQNGKGMVVFICRRGNDSQIAAKMLIEKVSEDHKHKIKDTTGGLHAWATDVDPNFPIY